MTFQFVRATPRVTGSISETGLYHLPPFQRFQFPVTVLPFPPRPYFAL